MICVDKECSSHDLPNFLETKTINVDSVIPEWSDYNDSLSLGSER
jgi:hypothetical protein